MKIFYEGNLNGNQVKVDEVNVHVDATRYPVRHIPMVNVIKAKKPNLIIPKLVTNLAMSSVLICLMGLGFLMYLLYSVQTELSDTKVPQTELSMTTILESDMVQGLTFVLILLSRFI